MWSLCKGSGVDGGAMKAQLWLRDRLRGGSCLSLRKFLVEEVLLLGLVPGPFSLFCCLLLLQLGIGLLEGQHLFLEANHGVQVGGGVRGLDLGGSSRRCRLVRAGGGAR